MERDIRGRKKKSRQDEGSTVEAEGRGEKKK